MRRKTFLIVLLVAFCVALSGCGKKERDSQGKLKIAGIIFQEDQFFRLVQFGMKDAADKAGVELLTASSSNKPDKEIQLVNTYIARQIDAIVISPLSATASTAALKQAHDRGVKIITYNTTIEGDIPQCYVQSDQFDLGSQSGRAAAKYIEQELDGNAKIAILAFKSQLPEQSNARTEGFKTEVTKLTGVQIVAEQDAWLPEMAVKKVGDIITAQPDVNIIWAANEGGTVGSVMAVKNAGKSGSVAVFGTDISKQLISFLLADDNILQAITGQRPFEIGQQAVESAVKVLKNQPVEKKISMPGVLLSRQDPDSVLVFKKRLDELVSLGSR
jgi:simple sugar transport system substrate-binding protein/ribose transport system substrate-binding protein